MADIELDFVGPGARLAIGSATRAAASEASATISAATAESAAGPTYSSTAAGLASTSDGEAFAVDNGDGTVTVYLNNLGVAVAQRTLATTAYSEATYAKNEDLASTEADKGATLVNFTPYNITYTIAGQTPTSWSVYETSGESGRTARHLMEPADRGSHSGEQFSGLGLSLRPTGSLANGPANADIGFNISVIKGGTNVGEIDGLNIVVRQAGTASDACAILTDVAGWNGGTGFWGQHEGTTKHIDGGGTTLLDIRTQMGVIDTVNNTSFGYYATPNTGTIDYGLLFITEVSGGQFGNHITAIFEGRTAFQVDGDGRVYVNPGDLETGQYARQECYLLEAASGNALAGHVEFNRYAAGSDWTSTELRFRGSVDGSDAAASSPWMSFRGLSGGTSQITFGYGVGASAFDRVVIPIGGGIQIIDLPSFSFADDTAAAAGGVPVGGLYHTSGAVKVRLT